MKTTLNLTKAHTHRSSIRREQARNRERARFDFQIAMDLIGLEFRRLRVEQGLAIETVARAVKMSKYRLCQVEHGMYIHFTVPQMRRLSTYYGVSHLEVLAAIPGSLFGLPDL